MSMFKWELVDPGPGEAVAPHQRLAWGKTVGLGAQHVVAMFGATFVFPIVMGLNANLAIMMSGIATICFLLIVKGKVPSYLGTSAAFVGGATAIYSYSGEGGPGGPADVTGAILVAGVVLALVGLVIHFLGADAVNAVLPPVVTGAVVMLIGFNLAPVATQNYMPADPWAAIITMAAVILMAVGLRGFFGRVAIFLGLIFGYLLSWVFDLVFGKTSLPLPGDPDPGPHWRVDWTAVKESAWFGFPGRTEDGLVGNQNLADNLGAVGWHTPAFSFTFVLLVLPAVIALVAENVGHVKAVSEMTGADLDPVMGRAVGADGVATVIATSVGGSPTTTYAENIGVMAATRVYSTAAYFVAALVAILLGLVPKFGEIVNATPPAVLGGITLVLYGMIGLLGAKIWRENGVNFANPVNLVPIGAGIILAIGEAQLKFTDDFVLTGIALGTLVVVLGYHVARLVAPSDRDDGAVITVGRPGTNVEDHAAPHHHDHKH
ncbi:nitrate reductase [Nocardioides sp. dk4132]|uniref:uracil-xanthine permease family protein n=1 Tax=unclassified Nocardioides TaxID=2615069 RepID=UPI0012965F4D|nr:MULTISPECIES: solute carrier family 23 protein [unclassified Nocardioides]MQW75621.1 nitrate reductase [Nocardioides sp. dk4132]QGA08520.1 nitrate reductase [Nocardioides sp. dk884]